VDDEVAVERGDGALGPAGFLGIGHQLAKRNGEVVGVNERFAFEIEGGHEKPNIEVRLSALQEAHTMPFQNLGRSFFAEIQQIGPTLNPLLQECFLHRWES